MTGTKVRLYGVISGIDLKEDQTLNVLGVIDSGSGSSEPISVVRKDPVSSKGSNGLFRMLMNLRVIAPTEVYLPGCERIVMVDVDRVSSIFVMTFTEDDIFLVRESSTFKEVSTNL